MANTSIRVDTVGLGINWALGETYRVQMDEGFIRQSDGLQLPIRGNNSIMTFSTPANPPQIANTIPTHTSTAPINITDISFTIDRSVGNLTVLGGNVFLNRQGSPNIVVKTFAVSNASITGNTVAFSVIGNLEASQTYFITSNANIFLDRDGFKNNAITNSSSFRFISPTAPTVTAFTPGNATVASRNFTNVAIDFDRTIFSNSGNLFLHNANTNAVIRRYPISSGLISNNKVTLDVVGNIAGDGYYYITSNANVVMDVTQIKYPGLTNASTFTFKAPVSPYLESTVPTNATTSASRSLTTASFTLDRTVTAVSGNVYLYEQSSPNVLLKTWTIGSNVSFNNDRTFSVTVPQGMLAPTQAYYVTTDANIAKDLTHINFPGISTIGNTFTFTTDVAPLISTFSPTYMEAIDETNNTISFTMDRTVNKNVGNIYLYKNDIVNGNTLIFTYNLISNTTLTTNTTISANVAGKLLVMEKYFVTTDPDLLSDFTTGEKFQGILNANTFVFTTAVDREYYANEFRKLFPNNVPQITDANSASTYSITITMSNNIGQIQQLSENFASPAGWNSGTRTYTITGTKTDCNTILANLYYFPNKTVTSNSTITYSQSKDSVLQKTLTFTLFGRNSIVDFLTGYNNTYTVAEDSKFNFMQFYMYPQWDANVAVMFKSIDSVSGNIVTEAGTFNANTASGWTAPYDGVIHKTFSRPANISVYNSQLAEIRDIYYWLGSDYTSNVKIDALVGIESTVSGNTLIGGTVYSGSNYYTITPSGEYSLLTSGTYSEDGSVSISLSITDADVHPTVTYNVQMQQISPDPGLVTGAFTSPGYGTKQWGSISDTQAKSAWNAVTYYAPADYTGNILIGATITKIQPGLANVTLASNVAIELTNSVSHNEYVLNFTGTPFVYTATYEEDTKVIFDYDIIDQDPSNPTYYVTFNQISPDPSTHPMDFIRDETVPYNDNYIFYGNTQSISGSKSYIVNAVKGFYPPVDYTGNIVFGFTQIKSSYNGNITQASNLVVTYTNVASHDEYANLTTAGSYAEDINIPITANITDTDTRFTSYYLTFDQISPDPITYPANVLIGNTYIGSNGTIFNTRTFLNSQTKQIIPPVDWTGDITFGFTQKKSTTYGNITQASNIGMTFNNSTTHSEFSLVSPIILESEIEQNFDSIVQITDQASNKQYSVTFTANTFPGNLYLNNVLQSKTITFTGNKNQVNANIANLAIMADFTLSNASSTIFYTQSQTTDNLSQAIAVPINANIIPSTYYTLSSNIFLKESFQFGYTNPELPFDGYTNSLGNVIQISNVAGNVSVTISQTSNIGQFLTGLDRFGNVALSPQTGNSIVLYGNTLTVSGNAFNVSANLGTIRFDTYTGSNANIQSTTFNFVVTSATRGSNHPLGNVILNTSRTSTVQCNFEIGDYVPSMGGYFFGYYRDPLFDGFGNPINYGPISHYLILSPSSAEFEANLYTSGNTLVGASYDSSIYNYPDNDYTGIYWQDGKRMTDWWYTNFGNLSPAADTIKSTTISGFSDWYLPSARELLLMFSLFKPVSNVYSDWDVRFSNGGFGGYSPSNWETKFRLLPDDGAFRQNRGGGVEWPWWVHYATDNTNHWGYIPQTPYPEFQSGNSQAFSNNISIYYASCTYIPGSMFMPFIQLGSGFKVEGSLRQNTASFKLKWRPIRRHPI